MLQCMFISTVTLLHLSEQTCLDVEYLSENGICCNKCFQGNVWTTSQSHVHWLCHTSCYTNCKNSFSEVKFYGDPPPHLWFPGFKLAEECTAPGERSKCIPCPTEQYRDTINYARTCRKCKICKSTVQRSLHHQIRFPCLFCSGSICCLSLFFSLSTTPENDVTVTKCDRTRNTVCRCQDGYYKSNIDSEAYECLKCKACELNEKEIQKCEPSNEP